MKRKKTFVRNIVLPFFLLTIIFSTNNVFAADTENKVNESLNTKFKLHKKGQFYFNWGYNRSWYDNSDIHFSGEGHNFVLYGVEAKDRPSPLSLDYINPGTWSIPQFNFRIGYFISDKYSISIGWDHMKYVAVDYQTVKMYGNIDPSKAADPIMQTNMTSFNTKYSANGLYNDIDVVMDPDNFIHYEHTDGLNYGSIDIERYDELWQWSNYDKLGVTLVTGVGAGIIIPRTDCRLFGSGRNHFWNISGYGYSAKAGIQINLTKHIYLQSDFKLGYLELLNIHTTNHHLVDKAQQNIVFYENYWQIGFKF